MDNLMRIMKRRKENNMGRQRDIRVQYRALGLDILDPRSVETMVERGVVVGSMGVM